LTFIVAVAATEFNESRSPQRVTAIAAAITIAIAIIVATIDSIYASDIIIEIALTVIATNKAVPIAVAFIILSSLEDQGRV